MRLLLGLFICLFFSACVGLNLTKQPVVNGVRKGDTCLVHNVKMQKAIVRVVYGLNREEPSEKGKWIRANAPNARYTHDNGCMKPWPATAKKYTCRKCTDAVRARFGNLTFKR